MSIHNHACHADCKDEDCPGIHPSTGNAADWFALRLHRLLGSLCTAILVLCVVMTVIEEAL